MNQPNRTNPYRRPLRLLAAAALAAGLAGGALAMPPGGAPMAMPMAGMPMMGGRHLDRMLDAVDASTEQRQQIRAIADAARADLARQRDEHRQLATQFGDLFVQPTVDANAVEQLRQKMLAEHDRSSQRMTQAMLDVSRVLTPEQRKKLVADMREMRDRRGGPGQRPPR